jgi:hypothetical protein
MLLSFKYALKDGSIMESRLGLSRSKKLGEEPIANAHLH